MSLVLVKKFFEHVGSGDFPAALALFANDARVVFHGPQAIAMAGEHQGREAVAKMFASIPATVEIEYFAPHEFIDAGNTVVVLGREKSKVKATGLTFDAQFAQVWRTNGKEITELLDYFDTGAMLQAFVAK